MDAVRGSGAQGLCPRTTTDDKVVILRRARWDLNLGTDKDAETRDPLKVIRLRQPRRYDLPERMDSSG